MTQHSKRANSPSLPNSLWAGQTEATISIRAFAPSDFHEGETWELGLGDLPHLVSAGAPATTTITVSANP